MMFKISSISITTSCLIILFAICARVPIAAAQSTDAPSGQANSVSVMSLDYEFFTTNVEPIFLKRRAGHARCYVCHSSGAGAPQYLEELLPGMTSWTEEQSRRIFKNVSNLVVPGDPKSSRLLMHPLAPEAGGDGVRVHNGGRQFASQNDPDWQDFGPMGPWKKVRKFNEAVGNRSMLENKFIHVQLICCTSEHTRSHCFSIICLKQRLRLSEMNNVRTTQT